MDSPIIGVFGFKKAANFYGSVIFACEGVFLRKAFEGFMKQKPTKLQIDIGILSKDKDQPVAMKGNISKQHTSTVKRPIQGKAKIKKEAKGRGGHPVLIIFHFSDGEALNPGSLEDLCRNFKSKLGCGGTVDKGEIILQTTDQEKVKKIALNLGIQIP